MRDYLFRGKRIDNGEWVEGCGIIATENWVSIFTVIDDIDENSSEVNEIEVLPETVGQYTGLTDKNGKKIFEGDIVTENSGDVRLLCDINKKKNHIGVVKFGEHSVPSDDPFEWGEAYGFFIDGEVFTPAISEYGHYHDYDLEVIGNIHDNPELMKGGDGND